MAKKSELIKVSAPGRICLAGEHCDYAKGKCIGISIKERVWVSGQLNYDGQFRVKSNNKAFAEKSLLSFDRNSSISKDHPLRYCQAVVLAINNQGINLSGANLIIDSEVPIGKGLSSSAALCVATAKFFSEAMEINLGIDEIAEIAYKAEHDILGIGCGRLDQIVSAYESLVLLDFSRFFIPKVVKLSHNSDIFLLVCIPEKQKKDTLEILRSVNTAYFFPKTKQDLDFINTLDNTIPSLVVDPMIEGLNSSNLDQVGDLMRKNQELYNNYFAPLSKYLDAKGLYENLKFAKSHGSIGEKWTGAGGDGSFICLCESTKSREKLKKAFLKKKKVKLSFIEIDL